jgi:hypothetical protein
MNSNLNTDIFFKKTDSNHLAVTRQTKQEVLKTGLSITGRVRSVGDVIERETGFSKRELVLLTDDYRPNLICFEFHNAKMKELDGLKENEKVEISFRIQGREWEGRVLNNLVGVCVGKTSDQALDFPEDL